MEHIEMIVPRKLLVFGQETLQTFGVLGLAEDCARARQLSVLQARNTLTGIVLHFVADAIVNCL